MSDTESSAKNEGLLTSVAETIGSALGNLAEKASAAQKSIGKSTARIVDSVTHSKRNSSASKRKTSASKRKSAPKKKAKISAKKSTASRTAKSRRSASKRSSKRGAAAKRAR